MESISAVVTWREVSPADVLSGARTLSGSTSAHGRLIEGRGEPIDTILEWARAELARAEAAQGAEQRGHAVHAVGHAKRAVEALFDLYAERDFLDARLGARPMFSKKLELLRRRLGDRLPWRLIPAIVAEPRDIAEHERIPPSVEAAGIAVEAASVVVTAMREVSNPLRGPALSHGILGGHSSGAHGSRVWVTALPPHFAWVWRHADAVARAGVGVAVGIDRADVIHARIQAFSETQHLELLALFDGFQTSAWTGEWLLRQTMTIAGLDRPR